MPSLDRIDSRQGYVTGNVQWVCWAANLMKQALDEADFLKWCRRIALHAQAKAKQQTEAP